MKPIKILSFNKKVRYSEVTELPRLVPCTAVKPNTMKVSANGDESGGLAELSMDNKGIYVKKLMTFSDARGKHLENLLIEGYTLEPHGTWGIDDNGEVNDIRIVSLYANKPKDDKGITDREAEA